VVKNYSDYQPVEARARLGFILPSSNRMLEPHLRHFTPQGVETHFTRARITGAHRAPLDELIPRITEAAEMLADAKCDVIVLQCTATSMAGGREGEKGVIRAMEAATARPCTTTASALDGAIAAIGAKKIVFISELGGPGHERQEDYLRSGGVEIIASHAMDLPNSDAYCATPAEFWYDCTLAARNNDADAYFVSCANIRAIEVTETLEAKLDAPVLTSNQAALWQALRMAGISDNVPGLGRLCSSADMRSSVQGKLTRKF
jgi:maleate isomerase